MTALRRNLAGWLTSTPLDGRSVVALRVARLVLVAGLAAYTAHSLTGFAASSGVFEDWLYDGLLAGAAALVLLRGALVPRERAAWLVLGGGLVSWAIGVVISTIQPSLASGAFPTSVDWLSLAYYPAAYAALVLFVRARVQRFYVSLWVDGLVGALALGAIVSAFAFPALLHRTGAHGNELLADIAYPLADLLLVGFVLWVGALTGWRPGRVLGLVTTALFAGAVVDAWSLWSALSGSGALQTRLDWLWPASAVLLASAAWAPHGPSPVIRLSGLRPLGPPVFFAASALVLLVVGRAHHVNTMGFFLAGATLAAVIARMAMTFAENLRIVDRSRREALTDPLTGLGNRRRLMSDLRELLQAVVPADPWALLEFDLDGFKRFNDTFGHPAGDELLSGLGRALADAVGAQGTAYRLGGDEFCVLVRLAGRSTDAIARVLTPTLRRHGPAFDVTASWGGVELPAEAGEVSAALTIADERLYAAKRARRPEGDAASALELLRAAVRRHDPALAGHVDRVATLSARVARRLGYEVANVDDRILAACDAHLRGRPLDALDVEVARALRLEAAALPTPSPDLKAA